VKVQKDLREFIELMNSHGVDYVIVGGHAVAYHGYPRFTGDMDFFVRASAENAVRVTAVLHSFGFSDLSSIESTLLEAGKVIQLGRPPNRIDLLTGISGVRFDEALQDSVATELDGIPVRIIGFESLLRNKAASGRPKDLVDLDQLKKQQERPPK
jgi:predicted nucleotidyltransferase